MINNIIKKIKRSNFIVGLPRIHKLTDGSFMLYMWGFEGYFKLK